MRTRIVKNSLFFLHIGRIKNRSDNNEEMEEMCQKREEKRRRDGWMS